MFQSSRPVAGARIAAELERRKAFIEFQSSRPVAGARISALTRYYWLRTVFQSSRPVAGARIVAIARLLGVERGFNPRAPLPGRASARSHGYVGRMQVSILAPRCRGAHHDVPACPGMPQVVVSILAPRCRGAHHYNPSPRPCEEDGVSILAPRCRGAHPRPARHRSWARGFNPRAPLPGRASHAKRGRLQRPARFNPRAPLPGRASNIATNSAGVISGFQSSRPVAGARILEWRRAGWRAHRGFNPRAPLPGRASWPGPQWRLRSNVSILAPRCRGAHPVTNGKLVARKAFQSSRPVAGARIKRGDC